MALAGPALAAAPTVTNIVPKHATHAGGTSVTIIGSNFTGATAVNFGAVSAASFTVNSRNQITAVSPPGGEGTSVQVTVTTPAGTSATSGADFYFYMKSCQEGHGPAVTSIEPHGGPLEGGTTVTIKGERFFESVCSPPEGLSVERVLFGSTEGTKFERVKEGELRAVSPFGTGTVYVTVEGFLGESPVTPSDQFTYPPGGAFHWYKDGGLMTAGEETPIVMFGNEVNLSQQVVGEVNCRNVGGGTIENPVGGGAGMGRTNSFNFYECKGQKCEEEVLKIFGVLGRLRFTTENNPAATQEPAFPGWSDVLEQSTVGGVTSVREKIGEPFVSFKTPSPPGMLRETEICEVSSTQQHFFDEGYEGELNPEIGVAKTGNLNGTKAGAPSQVKFNGASTGALESKDAGPGTASGNLKYLGYFHQELITVKP
jgi:hypothetical protein